MIQSHGAAEVAKVSASAQPIVSVTPFQLNQPHDTSASSCSFWGSFPPPPPTNISRVAVPNYRAVLVGSSGGVSRFPPPPQNLVMASQPPVHQAKHQNVNTSVAGGSRFSEHHLPLLQSHSTGSPNTLPPLQPTPSVQSNPWQFAKLVSNLSSTPMSNDGSSALSSVSMDPGPKLASSLPEVLSVNATPAPVTDEKISVGPTGVSFRKQSKLSPMKMEKQSGPRQSSPSQSMRNTNIDAKTALAPEMEPLPSDSTEETTTESLLKPTTKTLQGSTSSHHYKGQSAWRRDQVHRGLPWHRNVGNGVAFHSSRNHAVGRGDGDPHVIRGFKEDFDFEAMNEKFNKKEVWDFFRKNGKAEADDGNEDEKKMDAHDVKGKAREVHVKDDSKPVYCKDGFFDYLSYASTDGPEKVTLSEQRKKDDETFGFEIPILQQDHGQGSHSAGASQTSFGGREHGNVRGSRGGGRKVWVRVHLN